MRVSSRGLRCRHVAVLLATAVLVPAALAQPQLRFDAAGGGAILLSPSAITDSWNTGFCLTAAVRARAGSRLAIGPEVGYTRFDFDAEAFEAANETLFPTVNVDGNDLYLITILVDAEFALTDWGNTRPFARAALGWAHVAVTDPTASGPNSNAVVFPDPSDDAFTARAGLGVRTLLTPVLTLFLDASWQLVSLDPDPLTFVPIRIGLRF